MARRPSDAEYTEFVHASWPALYRTAYLMLGDRGLAEDLVQTALTKTYAWWGMVRDLGAARAYARTTMVNTAASWFRKKGWHNEQPTEHLREQAYDQDPTVRPALMEALAQLPPRQRAVVVLRFYEDLGEADIAETLGCRVGTVKSTLHRALASLRKTVEP
jgi:RNA polymerase sigma-70 factor (sigma-E family)